MPHSRFRCKSSLIAVRIVSECAREFEAPNDVDLNEPQISQLCAQSITPAAASVRRREDPMNAMRHATLGLAISMGSLACSAQQATIPFGQIERNAQLYARLTVQDDDMISSLSSSSLFRSTFSQPGFGELYMEPYSAEL